jgi:hypothetical protein
VADRSLTGLRVARELDRIAEVRGLPLTTTRIRKRRPSLSTSAAKSRLQRWFGACGSVSGARVPSARLRPPRLRTASRSSR